MIPANTLFQWFENTVLAQQLWAQEANFFQVALNARLPESVLQLGIPNPIFPEKTPPFWVRQSEYFPADLRASDTQTPWQNHQFQTIIAAHCIDYSEFLYHFLMEMYRITQANGCLMLTAFNPHSLWRFRLQQDLPDIKNATPLHRIETAAEKVGWICAQETFLYCLPPIALPEKYVHKQWNEYAGSQLWRHGSAVYALILVKQITNMQPKNSALETQNWAFTAA